MIDTKKGLAMWKPLSVLAAVVVMSPITWSHYPGMEVMLGNPELLGHVGRGGGGGGGVAHILGSSQSRRPDVCSACGDHRARETIAIHSARVHK